MITIPQFEDKQQLFDWLVTNKTKLIAQKKSEIKQSDAVTAKYHFISDGPTPGLQTKSDVVPASATKIKVRSIINTTKLMDSHDDVHMDQLWNKSLKENKDNYLVNQHNFSFEGIISDNVKAFVKQMDWAELGYDYPGKTQALVYDSVIDKAESPFMFEKYRTGKVKQHSVGMRYVKFDMAINDPRYEAEKATWDKYYPEIANKDAADAKGYFWAVTEAKNIEGSAVIKGSNFATPTTRVEETKDEPDNSTHQEPPASTLKAMDILKYYQPKI